MIKSLIHFWILEHNVGQQPVPLMALQLLQHHLLKTHSFPTCALGPWVNNQVSSPLLSRSFPSLAAPRCLTSAAFQGSWNSGRAVPPALLCFLCKFFQRAHAVIRERQEGGQWEEVGEATPQPLLLHLSFLSRFWTHTCAQCADSNPTVSHVRSGCLNYRVTAGPSFGLLNPDYLGSLGFLWCHLSWVSSLLLLFSILF